ncbi:hypothetical protein SAMN05421548_103162 [Paraburkholderia lycopersici]|uniref:Uncharacterized protein n=1 Tax=Paraburkholderia lycopersici TaxID=416944 RepID=A0A1G6HX45_9BURK|nr:hypothetical protein SAMN05421548_103162 [Paraburkholderia lycopersici]
MLARLASGEEAGKRRTVSQSGPVSGKMRGSRAFGVAPGRFTARAASGRLVANSAAAPRSYSIRLRWRDRFRRLLQARALSNR